MQAHMRTHVWSLEPKLRKRKQNWCGGASLQPTKQVWLFVPMSPSAGGTKTWHSLASQSKEEGSRLVSVSSLISIKQGGEQLWKMLRFDLWPLDTRVHTPTPPCRTWGLFLQRPCGRWPLCGVRRASPGSRSHL